MLGCKLYRVELNNKFSLMLLRLAIHGAVPCSHPLSNAGPCWCGSVLCDLYLGFFLDLGHMRAVFVWLCHEKMAQGSSQVGLGKVKEHPESFFTFSLTYCLVCIWKAETEKSSMYFYVPVSQQEVKSKPGARNWASHMHIIRKQTQDSNPDNLLLEMSILSGVLIIGPSAFRLAFL